MSTCTVPLITTNNTHTRTHTLSREPHVILSHDTVRQEGRKYTSHPRGSSSLDQLLHTRLIRADPRSHASPLPLQCAICYPAVRPSHHRAPTASRSVQSSRETDSKGQTTSAFLAVTSAPAHRGDRHDVPPPYPRPPCQSRVCGGGPCSCPPSSLPVVVSQTLESTFSCWVGRIGNSSGRDSGGPRRGEGTSPHVPEACRGWTDEFCLELITLSARCWSVCRYTIAPILYHTSSLPLSHCRPNPS